MALTGTPFVARCEQKVCRRMWSPGLDDGASLQRQHPIGESCRLAQIVGYRQGGLLPPAEQVASRGTNSIWRAMPTLASGSSRSTATGSPLALSTRVAKDDG